MMRDAIWPAWVSSPTSGLLYVLPTVLWIVWWLFGVNWKRLWPFLSRGAWAPLVLLVLVCTQAWRWWCPAHAIAWCSSPSPTTGGSLDALRPWC